MRHFVSSSTFLKKPLTQNNQAPGWLNTPLSSPCLTSGAQPHEGMPFMKAVPCVSNTNSKPNATTPQVMLRADR
eukprot:CAMPEP_0177394692 /NCGR_PEP_ID=MMETSP0368-20130122/55694_1 /TAXON_ID=447022 ORGANISM="Scrippsiella hangoei-like, Strain SHHI-4" /NCGR_SAMPLE_ID=MMETSP0368 /ASSEMBLY_ACC=CAM_ASM_000363 /LENGTH=73 /DNA_ID=CAMNT_0018861107 /DNA_START=316 /DNA_END=534 /DNA_ORIENTATION=+